MPADGGAALRKRLSDRIARTRDLRPALRVIGEEIVKRTSDAFAARSSPAGEAWAPLAPSTLAARAAKVPGARRRTKRGKLTKAAKAKRLAAVTSAAAIVPLVDTGRMRASAAQYRVTDSSTLSWSVVGYGGPHIAGGKSGRPPKRNFSVFERGATGYRLIPSMRAYAVRVLSRYAATGRVT